MTPDAAPAIDRQTDVWRCQIARRLTAPVSQVWRAFSDPVRLARWFGPEGLTTEIKAFDFVVDGAYELVMIAEDGRRFPLKGRFVEIEEGHRLVMTWLWLMPDATGIETLVSFVMTPDGAGTRLELTHARFADADNAVGHGEGWESSLRKLARTVEQG